MAQNIDINKIKDWLTFAMAVVAMVAGVIFWVGSVNDPKFEEIEKELHHLRTEITEIRYNNNEILRIVGRLEGKLEN